MKKNILILSLAIPFLAISQSVSPQKLNGKILNETPIQIQDAIVSSDKASLDSSKVNVLNSNKRADWGFNKVQIGTSYYDLQTNGSIGRRVNLLPGGKVSAVWTTSSDNSAAFSNRGTGYNHFDLNNWLTVANPTPRLEGTRLGWPSIGLNGTKEWVAGHSAADGGFIMSTNDAIGSTNWTSGNLVLSQPQKRPIWFRVANSGNTFHAIASYADSSAPGEPRSPKINGVLSPLTYSRSLDGGVTWDKVHTVLDGYDSTRIISGGGDIYAIDVRDSIVAIVTGRLLHDVMVFKSTDNGSTFTRIIADSFKYAPYTSKTLMLDTPFVCDGSLDVLIDNDGKVHAFWGVTRVFDEDSTDESYSFFPATSLLGYWNENTMTTQFIAGGGQIDRNGNGMLDISAGNWSALDVNGQIPSNLKSNGISSVARLGNTGLMHLPSAGVAADGGLYVTFTFPIEQDVDDNNVNRRDVFIVNSVDGGLTWSTPQDVSQVLGQEEEFACIAKEVDNFVHLIYQMDDLPGTNLQTNSSIDNNHPVALNKIMYSAIPVEKIKDGSISQVWNAGVNKFNPNKEIFIVSQNQPNPFSNTSEVLVWLDGAADVTLEIVTLSGQVVSTTNFNDLNVGNHILTIDGSGLTAGIYFYTIKTGTHSVTRKMSIN